MATAYGSTPANLVYTAVDANGASVSVDFTMQSRSAPTLASIPNQNFIAETAITAVTLPASTVGAPQLSYTLTPIPDGLAFNASTRILSGTPPRPGPAAVLNLHRHRCQRHHSRSHLHGQGVRSADLRRWHL